MFTLYQWRGVVFRNWEALHSIKINPTHFFDGSLDPVISVITPLAWHRFSVTNLRLVWSSNSPFNAQIAAYSVQFAVGHNTCAVQSSWRYRSIVKEPIKSLKFMSKRPRNPNIVHPFRKLNVPKSLWTKLRYPINYSDRYSFMLQHVSKSHSESSFSIPSDNIRIR